MSSVDTNYHEEPPTFETHLKNTPIDDKFWQNLFLDLRKSLEVGKQMEDLKNRTARTPSQEKLEKIEKAKHAVETILIGTPEMREKYGQVHLKNLAALQDHPELFSNDYVPKITVPASEASFRARSKIVTKQADAKASATGQQEHKVAKSETKAAENNPSLPPSPTSRKNLFHDFANFNELFAKFYDHPVLKKDGVIAAFKEIGKQMIYNLDHAKLENDEDAQCRLDQVTLCSHFAKLEKTKWLIPAEKKELSGILETIAEKNELISKARNFENYASEIESIKNDMKSIKANDKGRKKFNDLLVALESKAKTTLAIMEKHGSFIENTKGKHLLLKVRNELHTTQHKATFRNTPPYADEAWVKSMKSLMKKIDSLPHIAPLLTGPNKRAKTI